MVAEEVVRILDDSAVFRLRRRKNARERGRPYAQRGRPIAFGALFVGRQTMAAEVS